MPDVSRSIFHKNQASSSFAYNGGKVAQIIVLNCEPESPQNIGVISGDLSPDQAQSMCLAAARHFQELAMEAEIERRLLQAGAPAAEEVAG